jgi:hypothetical protein
MTRCVGKPIATGLVSSMKPVQICGLTAFLAAWGLVACGSSDSGSKDNGGVPGCQPNLLYQCPCADGSMGDTLCAADGLSFGMCICNTGAPGAQLVCSPGQVSGCACSDGTTGSNT